MFTAEVRFAGPASDAAEPAGLIGGYLDCLRGNGQILGREFPIAETGEYDSAYVMLPDSDALDERHHNAHAREAVEKMVQVGMGKPEAVIIREDPDSLEVCGCAVPASYILYTHYVSLEPPLRCGEEFLPVPLYRVPSTSDGSHHRVVLWAWNYQACDDLWMGDKVLERSTYRQLHDRESDLSRLGIEVRDRIAAVTERPVYYYLLGLREGSRSPKEPIRCPECGGEWLLERPWHDRFDYRCDRCHLLSSGPGGVL